jgi:hypothetical protein
MAETNELTMYDDVAGQGFENMGADKYSVPMLKIAQPTSSILTEDGSQVKAGDFYNSVSGESYGPSVELIPVYFNSVWLEWKPNMGGLVGRHKPYSVRVTGDRFTGLKTVEGNEIQEAWCYLVLVRGHEDAGVMLLSCTSTNIRHCKVWNSFLSEARLPSGKHAPLFSSYWKIESKKNKNDKGTFFVMGEGKATAIKKSDWVPAEIYTDCVKPVLETAAQMFDQLNIAEDETKPVAAIEDNTEGKF